MPRLTLYGLTVLALLGASGLIASRNWQGSVATERAPTLVVAESQAKPIVMQPVVLAYHGQQVVLDNQTGRTIVFATTPHAPTRLRLLVAAHTRLRFTFSAPGIYHLYDKRSAYVNAYQAGSDVVRTRPSAKYAASDNPLQAWIVAPGQSGLPLDAHINIPNGSDLFSPPVVAVAVDGTVILHNYDGDAHNIITDVNDPIDAAFELYGTTQEPSTHGAERRLIVTQPGLYHIYCSLHAMVMEHAGKWSVVVPHGSSASGFRAHNAMQAWVLVVPATS